MRNIIASIALVSTAAFAGDSPHTQPSGFPTVTALAIEDQTLVIEGDSLIHATPVGSEFWLNDQELECSGASDLLECDIPFMVQPGTSYAMTASWWLNANRVEYVLSVTAPNSPTIIETSLGDITHEDIFIYHTEAPGQGGIAVYSQECTSGAAIMGNVYLGMDAIDWSVKSGAIRLDDFGRPRFEMKFEKTPRTDGGALVNVGTGFEAHGQLVCAE